MNHQHQLKQRILRKLKMLGEKKEIILERETLMKKVKTEENP
jgi:hypothetical protein